MSADIGRRLLAEGHHRVNFAIVAAGANAASPHHEPAERIIERGEVVLCDFGGTMLADGGAGYCSDITRCVHLGEPPAEFAELYDVLQRGPGRGGRRRARSARRARTVDAAARRIITDGRLRRSHFIHRTGHGIGIEEHEDPYIVAGNTTALRPATRSRSSPASTCPGRWGARLEDIVVATDDGPDSLNRVDHDLVVRRRLRRPAADRTARSGGAAPQRSTTGTVFSQDGQVGGERPVVDVVQVEAGVVLEGGLAAARSPATCR